MRWIITALFFSLLLTAGVDAQEKEEMQRGVWLAKQYALSGRGDLALQKLEELKKSASGEELSVLLYDIGTLYLLGSQPGKAYSTYSGIDIKEVKDPVLRRSLSLNKAQAGISLAQKKIALYSQGTSGDPNTVKEVIALLRTVRASIDILYNAEQSLASEGTLSNPEKIVQSLEEEVLSTYSLLSQEKKVHSLKAMNDRALIDSSISFFTKVTKDYLQLVFAKADKNETREAYVREWGKRVQMRCSLYSEIFNERMLNAGAFWSDVFLYNSLKEVYANFCTATAKGNGIEATEYLVAMKNRCAAMQGDDTLYNILQLMKEVQQEKKEGPLKTITQQEAADLSFLFLQCVQKNIEVLMQSQATEEAAKLKKLLTFYKSDANIEDVIEYYSVLMRSFVDQFFYILKEIEREQVIGKAILKKVVVGMHALFDTLEIKKEGSRSKVKKLWEVLEKEKVCETMPVVEELVHIFSLLDPTQCFIYLLDSLEYFLQTPHDTIFLKQMLEETWKKIEQANKGALFEAEHTLLLGFLEKVKLPLKELPLPVKLLSESLRLHLTQKENTLLSVLQEDISFQKGVIEVTKKSVGNKEAYAEWNLLSQETFLQCIALLQQSMGISLKQAMKQIPKKCVHEKKIQMLLDRASTLAHVPEIPTSLQTLLFTEHTVLDLMEQALELLEQKQPQEKPQTASSSNETGDANEKERIEKSFWLSKEQADKLYLEMEKDDASLEKKEVQVEAGRLPW